MSGTAFGTSYSFARRTAAVAVVSLAAMLLVATLSIAALFLRAQIEHSRASALTQANVASSTMAAAMRFGGYEVINDALRVFDTGANHDSAAAYDRAGKLVAQRQRWYLGALRNLHQYGWKLPWYLRWVYWRQQLGLMLSVVLLVLVMATWAWSIMAYGFGVSPLLTALLEQLKCII